jgi:hypothetical protein
MDKSDESLAFAMNDSEALVLFWAFATRTGCNSLSWIFLDDWDVAETDAIYCFIIKT